MNKIFIDCYNGLTSTQFNNYLLTLGSCNQFAKYVHIIWSLTLVLLLVVFCSATQYVIVRFKVKKGKIYVINY